MSQSFNRDEKRLQDDECKSCRAKKGGGGKKGRKKKNIRDSHCAAVYQSAIYYDHLIEREEKT